MLRRQFLLSLGAAGLLLPVGRSAFAARSPAPANNRRLIIVLLRGAVDGLNVVVPYGDDDYYRARSSIAIAPPGRDDGGLDLDGFFALHPALASLLPRWQAGQLAFVHAAGSPDATRSHFDAQDYLESGTPGRKATADGWMNRLLAQLPAAEGNRALNIGTVMPRILAGAQPVAMLASGQAATKAGPLDRPRIGQAFDQLYAGNDKYGDAYRASQQSRREIMAALSSPEIENEMQKASNGAPLPPVFVDDAARVARLMRGDPAVQLAFMAVGGWDTHANQGGARGQLANRLQPLGEGLAGLADGLGPLFDDTTIVVLSEFGRTVRQNGNGGTDHGHGNVIWLLGGQVAGRKVHGRWPGLAEPARYENRDLAITTDFRSVLGSVLTQHLGLNNSALAKVFPDFTLCCPNERLIR
ncbi:MAG: hypothetical protein H6R14_1732 [Proteobacteria bacterium]|nr:hypothetical protein [Pseudomonadota bacterium]